MSAPGFREGYTPTDVGGNKPFGNGSSDSAPPARGKLVDVSSGSDIPPSRPTYSSSLTGTGGYHPQERPGSYPGVTNLPGSDRGEKPSENSSDLGSRQRDFAGSYGSPLADHDKERKPTSVDSNASTVIPSGSDRPQLPAANDTGRIELPGSVGDARPDDSSAEGNLPDIIMPGEDRGGAFDSNGRRENVPVDAPKQAGYYTDGRITVFDDGERRVVSVKDAPVHDVFPNKDQENKSF